MEVGDIGRFADPKQIQKLAVLEIVKKSSGKKKGQPRISNKEKNFWYRSGRGDSVVSLSDRIYEYRQAIC